MCQVSNGLFCFQWTSLGPVEPKRERPVWVLERSKYDGWKLGNKDLSGPQNVKVINGDKMVSSHIAHQHSPRLS